MTQRQGYPQVEIKMLSTYHMEDKSCQGVLLRIPEIIGPDVEGNLSETSLSMAFSNNEANLLRNDHQWEVVTHSPIAVLEDQGWTHYIRI